MKVKTAELKGAQLDWAVAKCEGRTVVPDPMAFRDGSQWVWEEIVPKRPAYGRIGTDYSPSTKWTQGGPIIEREKIGIGHSWEGLDWLASAHDVDSPVLHGPTALIAAMRCYAASKFGDEVEVPDDLT